MHFLGKYLRESASTMERDGTPSALSRRPERADAELRELSDETNEISSRIEGFQANVCLNYGGRDEIFTPPARLRVTARQGERTRTL